MGKKANSGSSMGLIQIEDKKITGRMAIFEIILTVVLSIGCWYTFFSMFPSPVSQWIIILLAVGLPVGFYLLCRNAFIRRYIIFYVFILVAAYFIIAYKAVWNGFLVMANLVVEVLNNQLGKGLVGFQIAGDASQWSRDTFMALVPVFLLVSVSIAYSVYRKEPLLGFSLTALPVVIGLCLKATPAIWLFVLLILGWIGLLVLSAVAKPLSLNEKKPIYIQSEKGWKLPLIFLGIAMVLTLCYMLIFSGDDYRPPVKVDDAKEMVMDAEESLRYGGNKIQGLSQGDLTKTHPINYTEEAVMTLNMEVPQSMYLRGFVGGTYENQKWEPTAEEYYSGDYTGVTQWLAQQGFYPWMQQDRLYRMSPNYDFANVDVKNISGDSRYTYLPYEAAMTSDITPENVNFKRDFGAFSKGLMGNRTYSFTTFLAAAEDYHPEVLSKWASQVKAGKDYGSYWEAEQVYQRFVYDTYLAVPDEASKALKNSGIEKCFGKTIEYTLHYIRTYFSKGYQYDVAQDKAPEGADELAYFMNKSKTGDDMHFATGAVFMFRQSGIPARYAEGYYLSPDYMKLYNNVSNINVPVPDSLNHSWVEVYVDEIGWIPVEIIPGFFTLQKQETQEVEDREQIKEEEEQIKPDEVEIDQDKQAPKPKEKQVPLAAKILLLLILLIAVYEAIGRYGLYQKKKKFGVVFTNQQAYMMYRYIAKLMAFDGFEIMNYPYERAKQVSEAYDPYTQLTFDDYLRMMHRVRFSDSQLTEEEHKEAALYSKELSRHIYSKQKKLKQFAMKFIFFYV